MCRSDLSLALYDAGAYQVKQLSKVLAEDITKLRVSYVVLGRTLSARRLAARPTLFDLLNRKCSLHSSTYEMLDYLMVVNYSIQMARILGSWPKVLR